MALQGTLETFALPDVLRLLDTTKNTGCLALNADGVTGAIHLDQGEIVAAESTRVAEHRPVVDVVFDLLRFSEGTFAFDGDVEPHERRDPVQVDEVLVEAESMLAEWREIEKVVPSLDHWVTLATDIPSHEVIVSSARWRTVAAVGSGRTVRGVGDSLDLGEVDVSRTVKDLVESGLAVMGEDVSVRTVSDRLSSLGGDPEPSSNGSEVVDPSEVGHADIEHFGDATGDDTVELDATAGFDPSELQQEMAAASDNVVQLAVPANASDVDGGEPQAANGLSADDAFLADVFPGLAGRSTTDGASTAESDTADEAEAEVSEEELTRQLANLSPKAAAAVQAASEASTDEERDAALEEVDEDDEDINRGLLLKFLGSVNN